MDRYTRPIGWIGAARKTFESFPAAVQDRVATALTIVAEGGKAETDLIRRRLARLRRESGP